MEADNEVHSAQSRQKDGDGEELLYFQPFRLKERDHLDKEEEKCFVLHNYILLMNSHKHTAQEPSHLELKTYTISDCIHNKSIRI